MIRDNPSKYAAGLLGGISAAFVAPGCTQVSLQDSVPSVPQNAPQAKEDTSRSACCSSPWFHTEAPQLRQSVSAHGKLVNMHII